MTTSASSARRPGSLRVGIIGPRRMGMEHVKCLEQWPADRVAVAAFCDLDPDVLAQRRTDHPEATTYIDHHAMLEAEPLDLVVIATPNATHAPLIEDCLARGVHVFCEKPVHSDLGGVDRVRRAAQQSAGRLFFHLEMRTDPCQLELMRVIREREFGGVVHGIVHALRGPYQRAWMLHRATSGGLIPDKCIHYFDLLQWWIGSPPRRVMAVGSQAHDRVVAIEEDDRVVEPDQPDNAYVVVEYENGKRSQINLNMLGWMKGVPFQTYELYLEAALLRTAGFHRGKVEVIPYGPRPYTELPDTESRDRVLPPDQGDRSNHGGLVAQTIDRVVTCLLEDASRPEELATVDDACIATVTSLLAEASLAADGRWIDVPDLDDLHSTIEAIEAPKAPASSA